MSGLHAQLDALSDSPYVCGRGPAPGFDESPVPLLLGFALRGARLACRRPVPARRPAEFTQGVVGHSQHAFTCHNCKYKQCGLVMPHSATDGHRSGRNRPRSRRSSALPKLPETGRSARAGHISAARASIGRSFYNRILFTDLVVRSTEKIRDPWCTA